MPNCPANLCPGPLYSRTLMSPLPGAAAQEETVSSFCTKTLGAVDDPALVAPFGAAFDGDGGRKSRAEEVRGRVHVPIDQRDDEIKVSSPLWRDVLPEQVV